MYIENNVIKKYVSLWLMLMFLLVALIIIVGGLTRLTDSGLSITEWQLFSGIVPPLNEDSWNKYFNLYKEIPEYKIQNYSMSLSDFKVIFWWEYIHRFLGRLIGISFILPLLFFSYKIGFKNLTNLYLIFLLICFQGFIGWYMVSSGLVDRVDVSHFRLSVHLIIAFIILSLIFINYLNLINIKFSKKNLNFFIPVFFLILIFVQIVLGAFVSGLDAGKIYNSWPLMGSSFFPDDNNLSDLFKFNAFNDPSLVQFIHRNFAYIIILFYVIILFKIYNSKITRFFYIIKIIGLCLFIQVLLGILTLVSGAQIYLSSMHQISSIFLVSLCVYFFYINSKSN